MFYKTQGNVPFYKSTLLDNIPHGFATRFGGVSVGEYTKYINFAYNRGDSDDIVVKNFEIFAHAIGADPRNGLMLSQVHSNGILNVTQSEFGLGVYKPAELTYDGYVSNTPGALLCVRVADCIPILLCDKSSHIIGAAHAGWRGSAAKIAAECVKEMVKLGADKNHIKAAVGPGICQSCFEVREDFVLECTALLGKEYCDKFIKNKNDEFYSADIKHLNKLVLTDVGIKEENIDVTDICTSCNPNEFFSHRYHKNNRGTLCAMIALNF